MSQIAKAERVYDELEFIRQELATVKTQLAEIVKASQDEGKARHPHIVRSAQRHRGEPTIQGSSITVRTIVERTRLGDTPEQIIEAYPVLTLAQVHAALGYYYDHPGEIESYIQENREALWRIKTPGSS
jgi:uncharacterized protein (DUF433 family)